MKKKRSVWLWALSLWVLALGAIGLWRGAVLWQERLLLYELQGTLSPGALTAFVCAFALCGSVLVVSAAGLWFRQGWSRTSARVGIPLHAFAFQIYSWFFVRSGLIWERRWVALAGLLAVTLVAIVALTWKRARAWIGLE